MPSAGWPRLLATWAWRRLPRIVAARWTADFLKIRVNLLTIVAMSDQRRRFEDQRYVYFITFSVYKRR